MQNFTIISVEDMTISSSFGHQSLKSWSKINKSELKLTLSTIIISTDNMTISFQFWTLNPQELVKNEQKCTYINQKF